MLRSVLLVSLPAFFALSASGADTPATNWMARVDPVTLISAISLPGTHNAGALKEPLANTARCQSATIAEQLAFGVRLLDIRCYHRKDAFEIRHGMARQDLLFAEVVKAIDEFLTANPSETVVMSVAETHRPRENTRSFAQTLLAYIAKNPARWHVAPEVPTLGAVRGKIVLLRRFPHDKALGLDASQWPGNRVFRKNGLQVQDRFRARHSEEKWTLIEAAFGAARKEANPRILHLNFTSGYEAGTFGLPNITAVSTVINPKLKAYLEKSAPGFHGWVIMDFATAELSMAIAGKNW